MVILDTDLVSLIARSDNDEPRTLNARLRHLTVDQVVTTIVTYEEQMRGWLSFIARAKNVSAEINAYGRLMMHVEFFRRIPVIPFDEFAAVEFQRLRKLRIRIGTMDLKIASIAIARNTTLLSRNLRDFSLVPGLDVQDWSS